MSQYFPEICTAYLSDTDCHSTLRAGGASDAVSEAVFGVKLRSYLGRAVAQAVSRWLSTTAARVRVRAACGVCGGQSGTGAGFLRVLRFPLPIIPPVSPSS
jgi:hypothetical protein